MGRKIKVLVVDDSAFYLTLLSGILAEGHEFEVVATAEDPFDAREKIKRFNPDVITLDVEMPGMDGITFLEKIMTLRPLPVVMVSTLTGKGTSTAVEALQIGAVECIAKPTADSEHALKTFANELRMKVQVAASARLSSRARVEPAPKKNPHGARTLRKDTPSLIAIGASTGGVEALAEVLRHLPKACPPIAVVQHMPPLFTASFATRLSSFCELDVREASHGMKLLHGMCAIAPGGKHLEIRREGTQLLCAITDGEPVSLHKPSVDVMMASVTRSLGAKALGVILTGMGRDGAEGLLRLRESGAHTIGQDEASCVVYGMPQAAAKLGAVAEVRSLTEIAGAIEARCFA